MLMCAFIVKKCYIDLWITYLLLVKTC